MTSTDLRTYKEWQKSGRYVLKGQSASWVEGVPKFYLSQTGSYEEARRSKLLRNAFFTTPRSQF